MFNQLNKLITLIFWLAAIVTSVIQPEGLLSWLPIAALAIAAVHIIEVGIFWLCFKQHSQDPSKDALFILVFGVFHFHPLIKSPRTQQ